MNRAAKVLLFVVFLGVALHADTPFYTESWSGLSSWTTYAGYPAVTSGILYNSSAYGDGGSTQSQLLYNGTVPSQNYSVQTDLDCGGAYYPTFVHYLRSNGSDIASGYQVIANLYGSTMQIQVYSGINFLAFANTSCGQMKSTINGAELTVSINGSVLIDVSDSSHPSGLPGVGTANCIYAMFAGQQGIGTTVLSTVVPVPPSPPTNLTVTHYSAWMTMISWNASLGTPAAISYNVYRRIGTSGSFSTLTSYPPGNCWWGSYCLFTDYTANPQTTYQYQITAVSVSGGESSPLGPAQVTTPTSTFSAPDVGSATSYATTWGAGPEKVSLLTGALGLRIPLLTLRQRSRGPGFTILASYNSQSWLHTGAGDSNRAMDVGFGLGWTAQIGVMYAVFNGATIDHFEFEDTAGLVHKLFQDPTFTTQFRSKDSSYLLWDYSTRILQFNDGSQWYFGSVASNDYPDAGVMTPTILKDSDGNIITVTYDGTQGTNQSSRIISITDSAATYTWFYSISGHVYQITHGGVSDAYFQWCDNSGGNGCTTPTGANANIVSPFNQTGSTTATYLLYGITTSNPVGPYQFVYTDPDWVANTGVMTGELTQVIMPYGGIFRYKYATTNFTNAGGAYSTREVAFRCMADHTWAGLTDCQPASNSSIPPADKTYKFSHPSGDSSLTAHTATYLDDAAGNHKTWRFINASSYGWDNGLSNRMEVYNGPSDPNATSTLLQVVNNTWTQDHYPTTANAALSNPQVCASTTILDPLSTQTQSTTEQAVDTNGNIVETREYGFGQRATGNGAPASVTCGPGSGNPAGALYRTTDVTYRHYSSYANYNQYFSRNILNRPVTVTVCAGASGCATPASVKTITYDNQTLTNVPSITAHDSTYGTGFTWRGDPTQVNSNGLTATMTYDIGGSLLSTVDALGHTVSSASYLNTGLVNSTSSGGNTTTTTWNNSLTLSAATGSNSDTTSFTYSGMRLTNSYLPSGASAPVYYQDRVLNNAASPVYVQTVSPMGKTSQTYYDGFGRVVRSEVLEQNAVPQHWITTQTVYQACSCSVSGKAVSTSAPYHSGVAADPQYGETIQWTTTQSDGLGRPTSVTLPDGLSSTYTYAVGTDTFGSTTTYGTLTTVTPPHRSGETAKPKRSFSDVFGRLIRVDESDGNGGVMETARYTYDTMGRMLTVQMKNSSGSFYQTRTFVYNTAGQLTSSTTPEKGVVTYTYQTDGLLYTKTEPAGTKTSPTTKTLMYYYDTQHRLTNIYRVNAQYNYTLLSNFVYDTPAYGGTNTQGHMVATLVPAGPNQYYQTFYSYDVMGRVTNQVLQTPYSTSGNPLVARATYGYDDDGNLTNIGYPGNLDQLSNATQALNCAYTYNPLGRATSYQCTDTNQNTTTLATNAVYNAAGQLLSWQEGSTSLTRGYDVQRGWLTSLTAGSALTLAYSYYGSGQVNTVTEGAIPAQQEITTYSYDNLNRLSEASNANWHLQWSYDEFGNRTHQTVISGSLSSTSLGYDSSTNQITTSGYVYDAAGNMTSMPGQTITYDTLNRAATINSATMQYDAFGRRVEKTVNGQTSIYFYDFGGRQLQTYQLSTGAPGSLMHTFAGKRIGQWTDRLGSKRADSGSTSHYYPYGEEIGGTANDTYKFAQTYRESDSGLDYANSRYYASSVGRFLTVDHLHASITPNAPQSWNRYSYGNGDPVNSIDPGGKWGCSLVSGVGGGSCEDPCDPVEDFCGEPGPPGPPVKQPKPQPWCIIDFEYRPFDIPGLNQVFYHGYLHFTGYNGTKVIDEVFEGTENTNGTTSGGSYPLVALESPVDTSHWPPTGGLTGNHPYLDPSAGSVSTTSADQCTQWLKALQKATYTITDANIPYSAYNGPNSGTALGYLVRNVLGFPASSFTVPDYFFFVFNPFNPLAGLSLIETGLVGYYRTLPGLP